MFGARKGGAARPRRCSAVSMIGPDMVVSGNVAAEEEVRIDGRVEGDVRCAVLTQGRSGIVAGDIVAEEARLGGLVEGRVEVARLVLEASARIAGDVTYDSLSIEDGARVDGRFAHRAALAAAPVALAAE